MSNSLMKHNNARGSALLLALLLVAILGMGAAAFFKHLNNGFDAYIRFERDLQLTHLADAGIDAAIAALCNGEPPAPETLELVLGEGLITVCILPGDEAGGYRVTSTAVLSHEGVVRASGTYIAEVRITPEGAARRLSWQRKKGQP